MVASNKTISSKIILSIPRGFQLRLKKEVISSVYKDSCLDEKHGDTRANDNWVEIKPKTRKGPNFEKLFKKIQRILLQVQMKKLLEALSKVL